MKVPLGISVSADVYQVLHCDPHCSTSELRKAFLCARSRCHPDKSKTGTEEAFRQVVDAYEQVDTPAKRTAYDSQRGIFGSSHEEDKATVLDNVDDAFADLINYLRGDANFVPKSAYVHKAKETLISVKKKVVTKVAEKMAESVIDTVTENIKEKVTSSATEGLAVLMSHYFSKKGAREPKEAVIHKTNIKKKLA